MNLHVGLLGSVGELAAPSRKTLNPYEAEGFYVSVALEGALEMTKGAAQIEPETPHFMTLSA